MTNIKITITPVPQGYELMTVRLWSDPVMQSYGYSVDRGGYTIGQFQVVTCFVWNENLKKWAGQWSAVQNYNKLTHDQMMLLANMQLLEHDYPYGLTQSQLLDMKDKILPDGYSLHQKMSWLYSYNPGAVMWGDGDKWYNATQIEYGTMVFGGQVVAVSRQVRYFNVTLPDRSTSESVPMRELLTFTPQDFGKSHKDYFYLTQWATVANLYNNYGEFIRGHVACPVALNPNYFDFAGSFQPTHYYLPEVWLKPNG